MKTVGGRRNLMGLLVVCFLVQTGMVYFDDAGRQTPPLSPKAQEGWECWHDNNCQSCHQLFGFGGFLGPDLTNAASTISDERYHSILTEGSMQMPAFHLSTDEIEGLKAFLTEISETGVGQLKLVSTPPAPEHLDSIVAGIAESDPLSPEAELGRQYVRERKCIVCHLPFLESTRQAPDLTKALDRLGEAGTIATIKNGRPAVGMPPFPISTSEEAGLLAFLQWLKKHSEPVTRAFEASSEKEAQSSIPWFEYPR